MLLKELTGVKEYKEKTASEILNLLKKDYGISISHGAYGVVLTHPNWDHVVKFFAKDDCYLKFVDFCLKNPNPHLPNFKRKPIKMSAFFKAAKNKAHLDNFYAVKIEKLSPLTENEKFICKILGMELFFQSYTDVIGTSKADEFLENYYKRLKLKQPIDLRKYKDLADIIYELRENKSGGCYADFNTGNFLKRGSTIVVIDPYASIGIDDNAVDLTKILTKAQMDSLSDQEFKQTLDSMAGALTLPLNRETKSMDNK